MTFKKKKGMVGQTDRRKKDFTTKKGAEINVNFKMYKICVECTNLQFAIEK